jgi:hypothetical protein
MYRLKELSSGAIPAALAQAERYRLLNEPSEAESICLDILEVEPAHQEALTMMVLALTDQFPDSGHARAAQEAETRVAGIRDEYKRLYLSGIIRERRGKAVQRTERPGSGHTAQEWLKEAMACYEKAEAIRPAGNDEALLRWNTCARLLATIPPVEQGAHEFSAIQSE